MRMTFYTLIGGFLLGVAFRVVFEISIYSLLFLFVLACCCGVFFWFGTKNFSILYLALFFLVAILGVARTELAHQEYQEGRIFSEGDYVAGRGTIIAEVDVRDTYVLLKVRVGEGDLAGAPVFRIKTTPHSTYEYGENISIAGTVHVPEAFESESGRVFDYPGYLMKEGVHYELRDAVIESEGTFSGSVVVRTLLLIKQRWMHAIATVLPEPSSSLAGGVIVGAKQSLGERWLDMFRDTGIIHIVVLSGYNLTLVANAVISMTARLPHIARVLLGVAGIASFAVMVGGGPTVVRASIMAVLGMLAGFMKRRYILLRALLLAGFMMVVWNPFVLLFDAGFQLSFMATAGLIVLAPSIERYFEMVTEALGLRAIIAATIATQLAVLPLLLFHIGVVSLVAPLVNVLVLPVVPVVMGVGFLVGLLGIVSSVVVIPFAYITHLLLSYIFLVVYLFSHIPYAAVSLPPVPWWLILLLYGVAATVLYLQNKKSPTYT